MFLLKVWLRSRIREIAESYESQVDFYKNLVIIARTGNPVVREFNKRNFGFTPQKILWEEQPGKFGEKIQYISFENLYIKLNQGTKKYQNKYGLPTDSYVYSIE